MVTELVIGISVAIAAFILSSSLIMNLILFLVTIFCVVFLNNAIKENTILQNEMTELDSQLIMSDSVNDILEHLLALRDELEEVIQMDVYTGEPVIQGLLERVTITLEKIESSVINQEYLKSQGRHGQE